MTHEQCSCRNSSRSPNGLGYLNFRITWIRLIWSFSRTSNRWNLPHCWIIKRTTGPGRRFSPKLQRNLDHKIHAISRRRDQERGVPNHSRDQWSLEYWNAFRGNEKPSKEQSRWRFPPLHSSFGTQRFNGLAPCPSFEMLRKLLEARTPEVGFTGEPRELLVTGFEEFYGIWNTVSVRDGGGGYA